MKHLKLFEEMKIDQREFPLDGHNLSRREYKIITDLVGEVYLNKFNIKLEDHYYYTKLRFRLNFLYNVFDEFNELKYYLFSWFYIEKNKPLEFLELLKTSKFNPSFDDNRAIRWASLRYRHISNLNKKPIYKEVVRLLLSDERVRSKLTEEEINKYTNEIS